MFRMTVERRRRGWNQQDLAYRARMSVADVSRIESGRLKPYPGQVKKLGKALGLRPVELLEPPETQEKAS
jgi:ribosome-binding protein aMBF1 (putative translation factor)